MATQGASRLSTLGQSQGLISQVPKGGGEIGFLRREDGAEINEQTRPFDTGNNVAGAETALVPVRRAGDRN